MQDSPWTMRWQRPGLKHSGRPTESTARRRGMSLRALSSKSQAWKRRREQEGADDSTAYSSGLRSREWGRRSGDTRSGPAGPARAGTPQSSLGLIVTWLVINASKHAFPDGQAGKIMVVHQSHGPNWTLSCCSRAPQAGARPAQRRRALSRASMPLNYPQPAYLAQICHEPFYDGS
jgi:hypothetical protein